jgi:cyclopropane fatty-acyl-phospholipid synthase-like methyltransferase
MASNAARELVGHRTEVRRYYDENQVLYDVFWSDRGTLSMGYGFWGPATRRLSEALIDQHREMASRLDVAPGERVLEAGCGVGGATLHLCAAHGTRATGITLSERQAQRCRANAVDKRVAHLASFAVADFTRTGFAEGAFGRLLACESVCHAVDKRDFAAEAFRLLRAGGRMLVADGFLVRRDLSPTDERAYREWCEGWAVPGLTTVDEFRAALVAAGFTNVLFTDRTAAVLPSSRRIRRLGITIGAALWGLARLRLAPASQVRHARACVRQHTLLVRGAAVYGIFTADKGGRGAFGANAGSPGISLRGSGLRN